MLGGDKAHVGVGRLQTLGGQAGGQFRWVGSACGIHTCLGGALGLRCQRSSSPSIMLSLPPSLAPCLISWEVDEQASLGQSCAEAMQAQQGNYRLRSRSQAAGIRPLTLNT